MLVSSYSGINHSYMPTRMGNLASTYSDEGRWKRAEELQAPPPASPRLRLFGTEHPETLTIMGNIASIYRNQGQWKGVEELEVQVKKTRLRLFRADIQGGFMDRHDSPV